MLWLTVNVNQNLVEVCATGSKNVFKIDPNCDTVLEFGSIKSALFGKILLLQIVQVKTLGMFKDYNKVSKRIILLL